MTTAFLHYSQGKKKKPVSVHTFLKWTIFRKKKKKRTVFLLAEFKKLSE